MKTAASHRSEPPQSTVQRVYILHYFLLMVACVSWVVTICLALTPGNVLHDIGWPDAILIDWTVGTFVAQVTAVVSMWFYRSRPNMFVLIATQLLAWGRVGMIGLILLWAFWRSITGW